MVQDKTDLSWRIWAAPRERTRIPADETNLQPIMERASQVVWKVAVRPLVVVGGLFASKVPPRNQFLEVVGVDGPSMEGGVEVETPICLQKKPLLFGGGVWVACQGSSQMLGEPY